MDHRAVSLRANSWARRRLLTAAGALIAVAALAVPTIQQDKTPSTRLTSGPSGSASEPTGTGDADGTVSAGERTPIGAPTDSTSPRSTTTTTTSTSPRDHEEDDHGIPHTTVPPVTPDRLLNEFAVGSGANPFAIAAGFHDDLWFTVRATGQTSGRIGRVTLDGTVTLFPLPTGGDPYAITRGPDAAMWFTFYDGGVGRISTAGDITEFFSGQCLGGHSIVTGPDGALWVASMYSLGRITTMGESNCVIWDMAPDLFGPLFTDASGGLWMSGNDLMLRRLVIQPSVAGVVVKTQQVGIGPAPRSGLMTQTVDGNLWFAVDDNGTSVPQKIGRMPVPPSSTGWTKGDVTLFDVPGAAWITAIAAGPDANIWFTLSNNRIGRMTPTGELTYWSARTPQGIAAGPDGNIWFTEGWHYTYPDGEGDKVARLDLDEL